MADRRVTHWTARATAIVLLLGAWGPGPGAWAQEEGPPAWEVDPEASSIVARGRQMGSPIPARFEDFTADIRFDPEQLDRSGVTVEIDLASIRAANQDVETEAKSEDWLDVERHPTARFESTEIRPLGEGRYAIDGEFTIKGTTKKITVPFDLAVEEAPSGDALLGEAEGEVTIQRLDFGIGKGEWGDTSVVSNEVTIHVTISGRRPK